MYQAIPKFMFKASPSSALLKQNNVYVVQIPLIAYVNKNVYYSHVPKLYNVSSKPILTDLMC